MERLEGHCCLPAAVFRVLLGLQVPGDTRQLEILPLGLSHSCWEGGKLREPSAGAGLRSAPRHQSTGRSEPAEQAAPSSWAEPCTRAFEFLLPKRLSQRAWQGCRRGGCGADRPGRPPGLVEKQEERPLESRSIRLLPCTVTLSSVSSGHLAFWDPALFLLIFGANKSAPRKVSAGNDL